MRGLRKEELPDSDSRLANLSTKFKADLQEVKERAEKVRNQMS